MFEESQVNFIIIISISFFNLFSEKACIAIRLASCSLEWHVLVWGEESHELWWLDDFDFSGLVDIEMSPCLVEVGAKVTLELSTTESLMCAEDFWGSGSHGDWVHGEFSAWGWWIIWAGAVLVDSIVLDHWSHEDIIRVNWESGWGNSSIYSGSEGSW